MSTNTTELSYTKNISAEDVLSLLSKSSDYSMKVNGVRPNIAAAASVVNDRPENTKVNQKKLIGILLAGKQVGFVDLILDFPKPKTIHIGLLLLNKEVRKKGIGALFLNQLEACVVQMNYKTLRIAIVETNNEVAYFWTKMGYVFTGEQKPYEGENISSSCKIYEKQLGGISAESNRELSVLSNLLSILS